LLTSERDVRLSRIGRVFCVLATISAVLAADGAILRLLVGAAGLATFVYVSVAIKRSRTGTPPDQPSRKREGDDAADHL
jgi:hypothetical protein